MKININKYLKLSLIAISIIIICSSSFLLYKTANNPGFTQEKISLFSCNNKANINYTVFLRPNLLYDDESIGEGKIYITEFIDYIKTNFSYEFKGDSTASIEGDYEVTAEVEGYSGEGDTNISIWKKQFQLLSRKSFNTKDKKFSINQDIPLKLEEYNNFADNVIKESRIGTQVKLTVFMNINLKANTDNGLIEEKLSPSMIIPLNTSFFKITGNLTEEKPGSIEETRQFQLPVNEKRVKLYAVVIGGFLLVLILLLLFTKAVTETNSFEKNLKKIFKDHGDRLVALNSEAIFSFKNHNEVKSIEDLVRIADEVGKPIMYKYSSDLKEILKFYVFDETQMYVLDLTYMQIETNKEEPNKEKEKSRDDASKEMFAMAELRYTSSKKEDETGKTDMKF